MGKAGKFLDYKLSRDLPSHALDRLKNPMAHSLPVVPWKIVEDIVPTDEDIAISNRLLKAYNAAFVDEKDIRTKPKEDLWTALLSMQKDFFSLLRRNDAVSLAAYLCNMYRQEITTGICQGRSDYDQIKKNERYRRFCTVYIKDCLVALAESVGAICCENPEQGVWGENIYVDIDVLIEKIEEIIGIDITPPPIDGGCLKICSRRGALFNEKDISAIYTAYTIQQLLKNKDKAEVCEIGAGTGRVAYYCSKLGITNYSIFDLPVTNILQGYYLLKSLPKANIVLYGEERSPNHSNVIRILPYWEFDNINEKYFDLTHNQDSFPEIDEDIVKGYLRKIRCNTKEYFLSINQESRPQSLVPGKSQLNVSNIIESVGGYSRISRFPFWLRRGYLQELYKVL